MMSTTQSASGGYSVANTEAPKSFTQRVTDPESATSPGSTFRRKRIARLMELVRRIHRRCGHVSIIDVGGRRNYWNCVDREFLFQTSTTVTIVNLPGEIDSSAPDDPPFFFAQGDGCNLSEFADRSFHIVHSNSVVEHVGEWEKMTQFAREVRRLAPNYFVQTPYFWFPVEPHVMKPFFHFLPRPIQAGLVRQFSLGNFIKATSTGDAVRKVEAINLLDWRMLQELFPDAQILKEKYWGFTKSLIAYRENGALAP